MTLPLASILKSILYVDMAKLFMIVNEDRFFLSHRLPVAQEARAEGLDVTIVAKDTGHGEEIRANGFRFINLPINPTGMNPREEYKCYSFLARLYEREQPDIVHHVGLKNILWGGFAAYRRHVPGVVNAVSGLGGLFNGGGKSIVAQAVMYVMRLSNNRNRVKVIFQNNDDLSIFLKHRVVNHSQVEFTKGSGINLVEFAYTPEPENGKIQVIFTGRMVREKGVCDLIEAAGLIKPKYENRVKFILCGRLTPNKSGVDEKYFHDHCDGNYISWLGERNDIHKLLEQSHIMAFPSYYREGVPKSLIEASAVGRPIITCNSTGCKDVVDDRINGILVAPQSPQEIARALTELIDSAALRKEMGQAARRKAELEFSIEQVVGTHIKIYNELLK